MQRRALLASACSLLGGCAAPAVPEARVAEGAGRSVLRPLRFGWLSSRRDTESLPGEIALGAETAGRALLFFEFDAPSEPRELLRAELVLDVAGPPGSSVEVELSRAEAASAELTSWSAQPRALYPRQRAKLRSGDDLGRLDVTELVRAENRPGVPWRLLLRAEPSAVEPVLIRTGAAGGAAPRLVLYFR